MTYDYAKSMRQYVIARDWLFRETYTLVEGKEVPGVLSKTDFNVLSVLSLTCKVWDDANNPTDVIVTERDVSKYLYMDKNNIRKSLDRLCVLGMLREPDDNLKKPKGKRKYKLSSRAVYLMLFSADQAVKLTDLVKESIDEWAKELKFKREFSDLLREEKKQALLEIREREEKEIEEFERINSLEDTSELEAEETVNVRSAVGFPTRGVPLRIVVMSIKIIDGIVSGANIFDLGGKTMRGDKSNITFRITRSWRLLCKRVENNVIPMKILPRAVLNKKFKQWKV